jgi:hypothetical protein
MKNFKKVIAFLMVAAMTLGMGVVAFADGEKSEATVAVSSVEAAEAGTQVTLQLKTAKDIVTNSFTYVVALNSDLVETSKTAIQSIAANYDSEWSEWNNWKLTTLSAQQNYNETGDFGENYFAFAGADTSLKNASVSAGTVLAEMVVTLKADVKEGDVIATVKQPNGYHDDKASAQVYPEDVEVVVVAKTTTSSSSTTSTTTKAATTTTKAATTATTTAATTTAAAATTAAEIKTADQALNALDTLAKATAAGAKLNKASFASEADYNAFVKALEAANTVLKNANATEAEKAAALKTLKEAMAKATESSLVSAAKEVVATAATTTKSASGKTKTGDTAPVAALMVVALAAFGTAVVVYRKKVNA